MYTRILVAVLVLCLSSAPALAEVMNASWYGPGFHGHKTASGAVFNMNAMTAAHKTLPFGTPLALTNLSNGRKVCVIITDRGPFVRGRQIDVSKAAAKALGFSGVARLDARRVKHC